MGTSDKEERRREFERLAETAQLKRALLGDLASRRSRRWRFLHFAAGFLALLSAGSMMAIIAEAVTSLEVKIITAALSLISGTITLLISSYYDEKETRRIAEGAAKFLALRDQADLVRARNDPSDKQEISQLEALRAQYATYSADFDSYLDVVMHRPRWRYVTISRLSRRRAYSGPPPRWRAPGDRPGP